MRRRKHFSMPPLCCSLPAEKVSEGSFFHSSYEKAEQKERNGKKRRDDGKEIGGNKSLSAAPAIAAELTASKSQSFNASEAFTVLWISPITCLARLIKAASAAPSSAGKLMKNDYLLLSTTIKFLIFISLETLPLRCRLNVNIQWMRKSFFLPIHCLHHHLPLGVVAKHLGNNRTARSALIIMNPEFHLINLFLNYFGVK